MVTLGSHTGSILPVSSCCKIVCQTFWQVPWVSPFGSYFTAGFEFTSEAFFHPKILPISIILSASAFQLFLCSHTSSPASASQGEDRHLVMPGEELLFWERALRDSQWGLISLFGGKNSAFLQWLCKYRLLRSSIPRKAVVSPLHMENIPQSQTAVHRQLLYADKSSI